MNNMKEEFVPSSDAVNYAEYILNHYLKSSKKDIFCLARDLELNHLWKTNSIESKDNNNQERDYK